MDVPSEYATIQAAIDAAAPADTVYVAAGTYATSTNGEVFPIELRNGVLVMSESGPELTIVDAEDQARTFECFVWGPSLTGFTITGGGLVCGGATELTVEDCVFSGNRLNGTGGAVSVDESPVWFKDCMFIDNESEGSRGGAVSVRSYSLASAFTSFWNCEFIGNSAATKGGAVAGVGSYVTSFYDCTFTSNTAGTEGGALNGMVAVDGCTFIDNHASDGGAGHDLTFLDRSVFWENSADTGGALGGGVIHPIRRCTFVGNSPNAIDTGFASVIVESSVIAFNLGGEPVVCSGGSSPLSCCDVFGNEGGDWVGCIAGQDGSNGNISLDPLFCDAGAGDLTLCELSPCTDENNPECGPIGALGVGCSECGWAEIQSVLDIPDDQGRSVRVTWARSPLDALGGVEEVSWYELHRRRDVRGERVSDEATGSTGSQPPAGSTRLEDWDFVATIPAHGDPVYNYVSPTLCDTTAEYGFCWSVFLVRAATENPYVFFDSPPDSGYSVDNLAPEVPGGLMADGDPGAIALVWDPNEEEDLDYYAVYRDTVEDFTPGAPIGYTTTEAYDDGSPPAAPEVWYRVTAFDFSGNESDPSLPAGVPLTGVEALPLPTSLVLHGNFPNPFTPRTEIGYGLPQATAVTLMIYDVGGRLVRRLIEDEPREAGHHAVRWDGRDDDGHTLPSGVYVYAVEAAGETVRKRMALIK